MHETLWNNVAVFFTLPRQSNYRRVNNKQKQVNMNSMTVKFDETWAVDFTANYDIEEKGLK